MPPPLHLPGLNTLLQQLEQDSNHSTELAQPHAAASDPLPSSERRLNQPIGSPNAFASQPGGNFAAGSGVRHPDSSHRERQLELSLAHDEVARLIHTYVNQQAAEQALLRPTIESGTEAMSAAVPPAAPALQPPVDNPAEAEHDDDSAGEDDDLEFGDEGEDSENEAAEEQARQPQEQNPFPWTPVQEDSSQPCTDEMTFIESKTEHSAMDHAYWEKQTFFDLSDPEFMPGDSGRIDWLVTNFNGTKENPNRQLVMKSQIVKIGGLDWQIKLYPKGNRTEFISVYLDCVSMQAKNFVGEQDFKQMPMPRLAGTPPMKQRVVVPAQVCIIMYNPDEARVWEYKADAHQYSKSSPDFGWKYFTKESRSIFHLRKHGQRQAILRGDRLAFSAYLRIINDPTGCLWQPLTYESEDSISSTSLRPLESIGANTATAVMLVNLRFVRDKLATTSVDSLKTYDLRQIALRALQRRLKRKHLLAHGFPHGCDVIDTLNKLRDMIKPEEGTKCQLHNMFEVLTSSEQLTGARRLRTRDSSSLQEALGKAGNTSSLRHAPPVLLIELERQAYDEAARTWRHIKNPVKLDSTVEVRRAKYILYGFILHKGDLHSGQYIPVVRPNGPSGCWYIYEAGVVRCITSKAADLHARGLDASVQKPTTAAHPGVDQIKGIAYLAWYIRDDYADRAWTVSSSMSFSTKHSAPPSTQPITGAQKTHDEKSGAMVEVRDISSAPLPHTNQRFFDSDVVMSDSEEDFQRRSSTRSIDAITSTPPSAQQVEQKLPEKTFNYFSGEAYQGQVLPDNTYHGKGKLVRLNGDQYQGIFSRGLPHGLGAMRYAKSNDVYEGAWSKGQHHGRGKFTEDKTGNVYEGGWKEGVRHGSFTLTGTVTEDDKQLCQICYDKPITTAFFDCGHTIACKQCARVVTSCPICRKQIAARLDLYGVKVMMQ